jgi:osmotically-inducible protein OsmY
MKKLCAWLLPVTVFVIGCAGHYGSNRNLPPRSDEPSATKADLDANDPTTHDKHHGEIKTTDSTEGVSDRDLAENVRKAIAVGDESKVTIVADDGVVVLRGTVSSVHDKQSMVEKAQRVAGVTRVEDHLEVSATR